MSIGPIREYLKKTKETAFLWEQLNKRNDIQLYGLSGSLKSLAAGLIHLETGKPLLYFVEDIQHGREVIENLSTLLPQASIDYFPAEEILPFEVIAKSHETQHKRLEVLAGLLEKKSDIVITTYEAVSRALISPESFSGKILRLRNRDRIEISKLCEEMVSLGYQRVDLVEIKGQFSLRGGIMDIFSSLNEKPYRLEFFDDEIESIRVFSAENQRSVREIEEVTIYPAAEAFPSVLDREKIKEKLTRETKQFLKKAERTGNNEAYQNTLNRLNDILEKLIHGQYFPGFEQYLPYAFSEKYSLLDFFQTEPVIIIDEAARQKERFQFILDEYLETYKALLEKGLVFSGQSDNRLGYDHLERTLRKFQKCYLALLPKKPPGTENIDLIGITAKTPGLLLGKSQLFFDELSEWQRLRHAVLIFVNDKDRAERMKQNLFDAGFEADFYSNGTRLTPARIYISIGQLNGGFELPGWKLAVLTEREIYYQPKKRVARKIFQEGKRNHVLEDLKPGEHVVHVNHGIGRYVGIEKLIVGEAERDYLVIRYQGEDKLYVPTDQAGMLQKYLSQDGHAPKLSRLGGSDWNRVKSKVKAAVKDMAEELLTLYASRQSIPGYAFPADHPWQRDFEEAFPYEETEDQLRAIEDVKKDMEKPRPMDRLICGDVGYGKTEVAIRAAFKAVTDGKQVAMLVPTTVLSQQHFNTFRERCEGFAVRVGILSRFCTNREQKITLDGLRSGKIDILIGTHRLLSEDIVFKDLGLLIIDEEQRFGVAHKEKLKRLRRTVDVLTLTATPIPRTLHMALAGARDMSVIETPPEDRYPIQTFVVEHSEALVREAIRRELGRGGQVYYVHNRIADITRVASYVQNLVPEAVVGIGHGRFTDDSLEKVMLNFIEGKINVLVSTTIIESGLDISNVNTMIINNADRLGLAQLYQLRGRIGRTNRVAYAYLTYSKDKVLSEIAEKRLNVIREFTELGAGFKIALKDLEIRGAGNILGAEQHGHVAAVGFDLYCRMLEEAVREAKGEQIAAEKEITIDLQVKAYIPQEYIYDTSIKIDFYQRIYALSEQPEIEILRDEMRDRFGGMPPPLENLLKIAEIKIIAHKAKINTIVEERGQVRIKLDEKALLTGNGLMDLARKHPKRMSFSMVSGMKVLLDIRQLNKDQVFELIRQVCEGISAIAEKVHELV